jgi:hypothetical protein
MTLKNGKAAGPDNIPAEGNKVDTETAITFLHVTSSIRSGRRKRYHPRGRRNLPSSCQNRETSGTAATTEEP